MVAILHNTTKQKLNGIRLNGLVIAGGIVIPEVFTVSGESFSQFSCDTGLDAVNNLTVIAFHTMNCCHCARFRSPAIHIMLFRMAPDVLTIHLIGISIARESDRICLCGLRSCKGSRGRADERGKCHKDCKQSGHSALENFLFHSFCPPSDMKKAPYFYDAHFGILN